MLHRIISCNSKFILNFSFIYSLIYSLIIILCSVGLEQGTDTSLIEENGTIKGVHYKTKSGHEIIANAPLTIVCIVISYLKARLRGRNLSNSFSLGELEQ
jgi:hypothetical protein